MNELANLAAAVPQTIITVKGVWMVVVAVFAIFIVSALILQYHWREYGRDQEMLLAARRHFLWGGAFFGGIILAAAVSYSF